FISVSIIYIFVFFFLYFFFFFFFFQAEDGIRDLIVTGVQTCALPISPAPRPRVDVAGPLRRRQRLRRNGHPGLDQAGRGDRRTRSEERRVGKECRSRGSPEQ